MTMRVRATADLRFPALSMRGNAQPLDATLTALAGLSATAGLVEQTAADVFTKRALGVGAATSVLTRGDGDGRYRLASAGITGSDIVDGSVNAVKIADNAVGTSKLANGAVTSAKLNTDAVTAAHIVAGAVGASELAVNSVTTPAIADAAVTNAKLADATLAALAAVPSGIAGLVEQSAPDAFAIRLLGVGAATSVLTRADGDARFASASALTSETNARIAADALKAPLASPVFTGNPTAPTQVLGNESGSLATTAYVATKIADILAGPGTVITSPNFNGTPVTTTPATNDDSARVPNTAWVHDEIDARIAQDGLNLNSPNFNGVPVTTTPPTHDDSARVPNTAWVHDEIAELTAAGATFVSPNLTGAPTAPTQSPGNDSTRIATTAFVEERVDREQDARTADVDLLQTQTNSALVLKADRDSPAFSGTPTAPTQSAGNISTRLATTQFVENRVIREHADIDAERGQLYDVIEMGDRPGEADWNFTEEDPAAGEKESLDPIEQTAAVDSSGPVLRLEGPYVVSRREAFYIEPGRVYELRAAVQRRVDTLDPSGTSIQFQLQCLTKTKAAGSLITLATIAPRAADGRQVMTAVIATAAGTDIDFVVPAGTIFGRLRVQSWCGAIDDIEYLQERDVSITPSGDVSVLEGQVADLVSLDIGPRLDALETQVTAPEVERFKLLANATTAAGLGEISTTTDIVEIFAKTTPGDWGQGTRRYERRAAAPGPYDDSFADLDGTHWTRLIDTPQEVCRYAAGTDITADLLDRLKKAAGNYRSLRLSPPILGGSYNCGALDISAIATLFPVALFLDDVTIQPTAGTWLSNGGVGYAASYTVTSQSAGSPVVGVGASPTLIAVGDWVALLAANDPSGHPYWKAWRRVIATTPVSVTVDRPYDFSFPLTGLLLKKFVFRPDLVVRGAATFDCATLAAGAATDFMAFQLNGNKRIRIENPSIIGWNKPTAINPPINIQYALDARVCGAIGRGNDMTDSLVAMANCAIARIEKTDMADSDSFGIAFSMCDRSESERNSLCGKWDEGAGTNTVRGIKFFRCPEGYSSQDRVENFDSAWKIEDSGRIRITDPTCFNSNSGINASHYEPTLGICTNISVVNPLIQRTKTVAIRDTAEEMAIMGGWLIGSRSRAIDCVGKTLVEGTEIRDFDTDANNVAAITLGAGSRATGLAVFDSAPTGKAIFANTSNDILVSPTRKTAALLDYRPATTQALKAEQPQQIGGRFGSTSRTAFTGQVGIPQSMTLNFGQKVDITWLGNAGQISVADSGGDAIYADWRFKVADLVLLGSATTGLFVVGAPAASQIGLTKAINTKVVRLTSGFTSGSRSIAIQCYGELVSISDPF